MTINEISVTQTDEQRRNKADTWTGGNNMFTLFYSIDTD